MDLGMDMWKYYGITHIDHTIMDPMSLDKFIRTVGEVTAEDITRVTGTYFTSQTRTIATLSHESKTEEGKK